MFILRPEHSPNLLRRLNKWSAEESLSMKAVMSSAYRLSFISVSLSLRPHMLLFRLMDWASVSTAKTNSSPDKGHPCLTPLWREKKFDAKPLLRTFARKFSSR